MYRQGEVTPSVLVAAFGDNVVGLEPTTGRRLWQTPIRNGSASPPRIHVLALRVIVCVGHTVTCLATGTGEVLWQTVIPFWADTLLDAESLLFVGGGGEVACLDPTGRLLWHDGFKGLGTGKVSLGVPGLAAQGDADS